ncbi:hypothetical protein V6N12_018542 [Hibiscus sabdariffa]|uniref:Uncharacterized protein n=1 Tax=Hibiscus sabdariffa TaxID=183260 RepID=A0ABR2BY62_9ROSI
MSSKFKLFAPPRNVENVDKDSRAASRNSLLHQEMLIRNCLLRFMSCKPKLFAPPRNVDKDSRAASRNSSLYPKMLA